MNVIDKRQKQRRGPAVRAFGAIVATVGVAAALSGCAQGADEGSSSESASGTTDITTQQPLDTDFDVDQDLHDALPDSVKESGVLRVATLGTNAPIVFKTDSGDMNGAVADFWNAFEKVLDIDIQPQIYSNTAAELTALDSGQVDVVWGSDGDTREREKKYDFIDYFVPSYSIYVQKGNPLGIESAKDICGHSYAGIQGAVSSAGVLNDYCEKNGLDPVEEKQFPDAGSTLLGVASGQAESWIYFNYFGIWQRAQGTPIDILPVDDEFNQTLAFGVVVPKDTPAYSDTFLKVFQQLKNSGYYDQVLDRWQLSDLAVDPGINIGDQYTLFG